MSRQDKFAPPQIDAPLPDFGDDDDRLQVDLRLKLDEVADLEAELLRRSARRQPSRRELAKLAGKIFDARRARDRVLDKEGRGLFGEPAWDMLLALYCLPSRGELLTITSLSYAAEATPTTGLRWQKILTSSGLIERGPDTGDLRRRFVRLTVRGKALMESYLSKLYYADVPLAVDPEQT